ncbi:MAG: TatD family hydrolase [Opitutaceae bacterium]
MALRFFDAHNHMQDDWLVPYRDALLKDLPASGMTGMVINGTSEGDWPNVTALAGRAGWIVPSYGLHPWDCGNRTPDWQSLLRRSLTGNPNAAVGEIGIDRWILDRAKPDDPRLAGLRRAPIEEQSEVFLQQLSLAYELDRPASIHCLDAWGVLLELLRKARIPRRGFLLHAYAGPAEMVAPFAALGAFFSFNGSFLDPRKTRIHETFRFVPAERLLMETDAPAMMPPEEWRRRMLPPAAPGTKVNHPGNIVGIYEGFSARFGIPVETLATRCADNFARLFAPLPPA